MVTAIKKLVSENLILRQQLIVVSRKHSKSPPLRPIDRIVFAVSSFFIPFKKLSIIAVIVKPATILRFHRSLVNKKYQILFGSTGAVKRGRKGFDIEIINRPLILHREIIIRQVIFNDITINFRGSITSDGGSGQSRFLLVFLEYFDHPKIDFLAHLY